MAQLLAPSGLLVDLASHHTIGRHPDNALVLRSGGVSTQHAAILWTSSGWVVRDLGSRNGTQRNDVPLAGGVDVALNEHDRLAFADDVDWVVVDLAAPEPRAKSLGVDVVRVGEGQVLALPNVQHPIACVLSTSQGWMLEGDSGAEPVRDGQIVEVAGARWRLSLPIAYGGTIKLCQAPTRVRLSFQVSLDEEHVSLTAEKDGERRSFSSRAHHYTLLTLARWRLEDQGRGVSEAEQGWIAQDELERMLRLDRNALYQHIYRARRELAPLGGVEDLVERRQDAGQLRIGFSQIEVLC